MSTQAKNMSAKTFDRLSDILQNGIDVHRCAAAIAMGNIGYPGSGEILKTALMDEDDDVRTDAMAALAKIKDPKTGAPAMENLLGDPCPEVKLSAIELLAEIDHREVVPWLLKLVTEQTDDIVWDEEGFYDTGWEDWLDFQIASIRALGKMGVSEVVPEILKAFDLDDGQDVTQVAIPVLASVGTQGLAALEKLFENGNERLRRRICSSLVPASSPQAKELFGRCLRDPSGEVRYVAIEKIIDENPDDHRLIQYFKDDDADIRQLLVEQLGEKHPGHVTQMFEDDSPSVRQAVFRVVAAVPEKFEKEGFSEVVRTAIAGVPEVAGDAAIAWAALIGAPSAKSLGDALQNAKQPLAFRTGLIEALTLLDDDGFPFLAKAAGDPTRQVRISALTALAEIAQECDWPCKSSEALLAAVRGELVEEIEEEEEPDQEVIEEPVKDEEDHVPVSTLDEIMKKGINSETADDDEEEPEVIELDEDDERYLEISERRAMRKGKVSLEVKIAPHLDVKRFAARLLGDFDKPGIQQLLCDAINEDDDELQQSALESLTIIGTQTGKLDTDVIPVVLEQADNPDRNICMLAARCFAFIDSDEIIEKNIEMCSDKDVHVRLEAVHSIGQKKGYEDLLIAALDDPYSGVRTRAMKALAAQRLAMDELVDLTLKFDGIHRAEVVTEFKTWNINLAAEKYLNVLGDEEQKRVWLVAITALGELVAHDMQDEIQAVA